MLDPSSIGEMAWLIQNLPEIMFWAQILVYIVLIFFFGSIAVRGYRGYLRGIFHFLLRAGSGFACLVAGIGISPYIPFVGDNMLLKIAQTDLITGGIISSMVLLVSFYIMTFRFSRILVLKKRAEAIRWMFEKTRDRAPSKMRVDPLAIAGIIIIMAFLSASLVNFRGFPDMAGGLLSQLCLTPEDLGRIGDLLSGGAGGDSGGGLEGLLPEGVVIEGGKPLAEQSQACISAMFSLAGMKSQLQDPGFLMSRTYSNRATQDMIERESGKRVSQMFRVTEGGNEIIIAVTEDLFSCTATPSEFCLCAGNVS